MDCHPSPGRGKIFVSCYRNWNGLRQLSELFLYMDLTCSMDSCLGFHWYLNSHFVGNFLVQSGWAIWYKAMTFNLFLCLSHAGWSWGFYWGTESNGKICDIAERWQSWSTVSGEFFVLCSWHLNVMCIYGAFCHTVQNMSHKAGKALFWSQRE